ncbi:MAG: sigma-70 family RNA polymerase sigma factor [Planctomycetes bacterium]|nr:sigma-70 family RNA polymerase sigma factor [Planctomycetota bacterium]
MDGSRNSNGMGGDAALPPDKRRDYKLLKRFAGGDEKAFVEIYERYSERLLKYTYRCMGDWQEAEDVVQEVFVQVMKDAAGFEPKASLSTWMYRIATFMCAKRHRDRGVRKRIIERELAAGTFDRPAAENEGEKAAELAEQAAAVKEAVAGLPYEQRTAFVLREYEDRSYGEIAEITGAETGTVKSRIFRARQAVRDEMKKRELL